MRIFTTIFIIFHLIFFSACSGLIEYSPYDTPVLSKDMNKTESARISCEMLSPHDTFKFALISDIHDNYDDMADAIKSINREPGLQFVVCCGDITNSGLAREYEWYLEIFERSRYPFITVIGNHDYRSNGLLIFERIFGPPNMSFEEGKYKFVLFTTVLIENNYKSPEYEWLA